MYKQVYMYVCVSVCMRERKRQIVLHWGCVGQAWADAFRSSPDLTGVVHIYEELKRKGIEFPMADLDALSPIHTPQRVSIYSIHTRMFYMTPTHKTTHHFRWPYVPLSFPPCLHISIHVNINVNDVKDMYCV